MVRHLEAALFDRDIATGFRLLDEVFAADRDRTFSTDEPIRLLLCVAQWIDLGYGDLNLLQALRATHPIGDWARLPLLDYLRVRLVEGYRMLATERLEDAIEVMGVVLQIGKPILGDYLLFLANFLERTCTSQAGRLPACGGQYRCSPCRCGAFRRDQVSCSDENHESWLAFQSGKRQYAFDLLTEAERELTSTGHSLSLGNIESARGRFVRRSGDYAGGHCITLRPQ